MNELKVSLREPDGIRQTWLTDEELDLRAGLYNQDGQFQRDIQRLWAECSDIILRISEESWRWEFESADRMNITAQYRDIWLEKALEATRMKYQQGVDRDWVCRIAGRARSFFQFGIPSPSIARLLVDVASRSEEHTHELHSLILT